MADFEYSPFDKKIRLNYVCPSCKHENSVELNVPEPDWTRDSHSSSIQSDVVELECANCGQKFQLTLATGISGGLGIVEGLDEVDVRVLEEDQDPENENEREEFEEKNAPEVIVPPLISLPLTRCAHALTSIGCMRQNK